MPYLSEMSIKVENVSKQYGSQLALNKVSFAVNKGEILGFLGPNGAGKSTLMKIITAYISADNGHVEVCDENVHQENTNVKKNIGYLPEHNPLYTEMYVKEYLSFIAKLYACSSDSVSLMIEKTGLSAEQHKRIGQLSKGYRQRVGLAAALIHDPQVLVLDEPTTGLDPNQMIEIRQLIKDCGKDKTVMLSSHIMPEVEKMCDRVVIIHEGNVVANERIANLKKKNINLENYFQKLTGQ